MDEITQPVDVTSSPDTETIEVAVDLTEEVKPEVAPIPVVEEEVMPQIPEETL